MSDPIEPFGPDYNVDSPSLRKFRKSSRDGIATLSAAERRTYGAAVEARIKELQASGLNNRRVTASRPICASGTFHNDGAAIHKAVKAQQHAALMACASKERRDRTPAVWRAMYDAAMQEKRSRQQLLAA